MSVARNRSRIFASADVRVSMSNSSEKTSALFILSLLFVGAFGPVCYVVSRLQGFSHFALS